MQKLKRFTLLFLFLFTLPIAIGQLPFPNNELSQKQKETTHIVHASTEVLSEPAVNQSKHPFHVLLLYTHSHETYKPVVAQTKGLQSVYDDQSNIYSMQEMMRYYFQLNQMTTTVLDYDVMDDMKSTGATFNQAYGVVRPVLSEKLKQENYDLVIDFHRDSAARKATTLEANGVSYAKVAFVVGAEHPGFEANLSYATALSDELNRIMPGLSRGIIKKQGKGVDGVYNQDLSPVMLLIELGGVDNTEVEIERTLAVITQAIKKAFIETAI
jgi:stage II sporulation protein P